MNIFYSLIAYVPTFVVPRNKIFKKISLCKYNKYKYLVLAMIQINAMQELVIRFIELKYAMRKF